MDKVEDINSIMQRLPHRYPFLLVDRILAVVPGESLVALKNVTFNEPFFQGHFPELPIMPGVLILEAMGQAGGVLVYNSLPPEDQDRLFAPFTQLHRRRAKGHGLGLSIVQRIATKLGGQVGVESKLGEGSLFWFTLPSVDQLT